MPTARFGVAHRASAGRIGGRVPRPRELVRPSRQVGGFPRNATAGGGEFPSDARAVRNAVRGATHEPSADTDFIDALPALSVDDLPAADRAHPGPEPLLARSLDFAVSSRVMHRLVFPYGPAPLAGHQRGRADYSWESTILPPTASVRNPRRRPGRVHDSPSSLVEN